MDQHLEIAEMQNEANGPVGGAARVGMEIRQVRERLGWRLPDVAAALRIRLPYLEAIERGELSALPGAAYQTGFVRTYSQALGLDGDEILRRFRAEGETFEVKAPLSFLAPVPDRAVPTGAIVLLGVMLVLVGYGLWYRHTSEQASLAANVPAVPTELAPLAVPPKPPVVAAPIVTGPAAPAAPATTQAAPPSATVPTVPASTATSTPATTSPTSSPAPTSTTLAPAAAANGQVIQASADDWVEVRDSKNNILFSRVLHAGESWPVPDLPGLTMTAGNAGATTISNAGKSGAPLGAMGVVLHGYQLTPAVAAGGSTTPPPKTN